MKTTTLIQCISRVTYALAFIALVTFSGCDSLAIEENSLVEESQANTKRTTIGTVYTFSDMAEVGTSKLRRNNVAIATEFSTSQLTENDTYTLWWVVFDQPEYCSAPGCGEDDVLLAISGGPNPAEVSMIGAAGGSVAGSDGRAYYNSTLKKYDTSLAAFGDGLDNPLTAEIHYVLRTHGPAIPGMIEEQTTTALGGCLPGQPNEGMCKDIQFAVHVSPFAP